MIGPQSYLSLALDVASKLKEKSTRAAQNSLKPITNHCQPSITSTREISENSEISLPTFKERSQEYWANLKLDLWEKFGAKLWSEDLLKKDESIRKERAHWEYANQGVLFFIENKKQANKEPL